LAKILITGGAGFIGSNLVRKLVADKNNIVLNLDKITYAGNLLSLKDIEKEQNYIFYKNDICDAEAVGKIIFEFKPDAIMHLAAESHVDRSIDGPWQFIETNIIGTYNLLQAALNYFKTLGKESQNKFRFLHISTDEVFGSLENEGYFTEQTAYDPSSPYSASKASSDHLVRAWYRTFGLPTIITNCSNNYGPYQFPEKLIPVVILKALKEESIPIYGDGKNIRDWLFVEDHADALIKVIFNGQPGETYNVGGNNEKTNLELVTLICKIIDELKPRENGKSHIELITFVKDRPGHDRRYAIDASKIKRELGFSPNFSFEVGIEKTVKWYLNNLEWCNAVLENKYTLERLGHI